MASAPNLQSTYFDTTQGVALLAVLLTFLRGVNACRHHYDFQDATDTRQPVPEGVCRALLYNYLHRCR